MPSNQNNRNSIIDKIDREEKKANMIQFAIILPLIIMLIQVLMATPDELQNKMAILFKSILAMWNDHHNEQLTDDVWEQFFELYNSGHTTGGRKKNTRKNKKKS